MSILSYRCPNTSKEIETSIDTEPAALVKMGNLKVGVVCPYCPAVMS
jgi:DNA-directed RNA polymerase subunit RPC12/RpoP